MNVFWIRLLKIAIKGLKGQLMSSQSIRKIVQKELNKKVMVKGMPDIKKMLKEIKPSQMNDLKKIFDILDRSPESLLNTLLNDPKAINRTLDTLQESEADMLSKAIDIVEPPEDGSTTQLIGVSSSWVAAISYKATGDPKVWEYYFTTKDGRGPYGPTRALKTTVVRMLAVKGSKGSGAGSVMWREVPHWINKRSGASNLYPTATKALRGF